METYGSTEQHVSSSQKSKETSETGSMNVSDDERAPTIPSLRCDCPFLILLLCPERNLFAWTAINNILAVSGCFLLIDLGYTNWGDGDPAEEQPFAAAFFMIWEFATCFFWTTETGLSAVYQHFYLHQTLVWYTQLELVIAAYLMLSTFCMLWEWNLLEYDQSAVWEIALDTSFYVYLAIRSCQRLCVDKQHPPANALEKFEETDADRTQKQEGYRIMENGSNVSGALL